MVAIYALRNLQTPYTGYVTHGLSAVMEGKIKWKPIELCLPMKISKSIPREISEISATIKALKDAGVLIPTISPFNSPI